MVLPIIEEQSDIDQKLQVIKNEFDQKIQTITLDMILLKTRLLHLSLLLSQAITRPAPSTMADAL